MADRHLAAADLVERLGISRAAAYRLLARLPRVRIGRSVRVSEADLDDYLNKHKEAPWGGFSDEAPRARGGATGPTKRGGAPSAASEPGTAPSPANDSEQPSWLRPLKRDGSRSA